MLPLRVLILLVCLFATVSLSWGADFSPDGGEIVIKADQMDLDQATNTYNATGNVTILWEGMVLSADQATYNRTTGIMSASGNITMVKGEDTLHGKKFTIDVSTGRAELDQGTLSVSKGNINFTGQKIVKEDENHILLEKTELTTCDLPDPSWKFKAEELKVNLLGYAIGRNVIFYIKNTPALYLPWIAFPVVRDRKSGLLFPQFGNSNSRGVEVDLPVYWVIAPNQDLQFDLDIMSRRGVGTGVEYRYARKRGSEGSIGGYLVYDLVDGRWRGQMAQSHKEIFSRDMNFRSVVNLNTDRSFLQDYGEKSGEYNRQSNDTVVNFLKTWQHYALTADLRYSEELYNVDNSQTLQVIPEIGLAAVKQKLYATPLYFDLDSGIANLYRDAGPQGQRLLLFPRLTLETALPAHLQASAFAGLHLRGYTSDNIPAGSNVHDNDIDLMPEVGARISTSLSRVYNVGGEHLKKLRHEITPEISYSYTPEKDQTRLPFYDYSDRLVWQNIAYYSLASYLGGKFQNGETTEYRDLLRMKLTQGYSFEGTRRDLLTMVDTNHPLTDLILESDAWLHPMARMTLDARYNVYDLNFSSIAPGVAFDDKRGTTATVAYRMSRHQLEYMEAKLATKIVKPWNFGYSTRYSFDRPGALETVYSAEYTQKCWSISVALSTRPGNTSFHFNINLAGLTSY